MTAHKRMAPSRWPDRLRIEADELSSYEEWRLDVWWVQNLTRRIFATGTRQQLDDLTRHIWPKYAATPDHARENAKALDQLKTAFLCRRPAVDHERSTRTRSR